MYETIKRMLHLDSAPAQASSVAGCACFGRCCESFGGHLQALKREL